MNQEKRKHFISIQNLLMLTLAGIINAIGVVLFLSPVKLYDSGISGTSMLLAQVTPESMPLSFFLLLLNIPLFLYGLKRQGHASPAMPSIRLPFIPQVPGSSAMFYPLMCASPLRWQEPIYCSAHCSAA